MNIRYGHLNNLYIVNRRVRGLKAGDLVVGAEDKLPCPTYSCWVSSQNEDHIVPNDAITLIDTIEDEDEHGCTHECVEPHTCPFEEEINGDSETLCTCCIHCQQSCAEDI